MSKNVKEIKATELDKNMSITENNEKNMRWLSPFSSPFRISGFPWIEKDRVFRRLPVNPKYEITAAVDQLANCTSGGQVCFQTDTKKLAVIVKLSGKANMPHMPSTGQCGFDCYIGIPGQKRFINVAKYNIENADYEVVLMDADEEEVRNITLNFPLYQGVEELLIGVDEGSEVLPPLPYESEKKVIFYGTSITQGGCAARPGMSYTNILSRRLNYEFINLGFSGNGKGEPSMARIITEIENPICLVLDYEANCVDTPSLERTLPEFIRIYRESYPHVLILVISKFKCAQEMVNIRFEQWREERKELQRSTVDRFRLNGDNNIFFYDGEYMLAEDFDECTVDGAHPTDLGFMRIADALTPVLEKILKGQ
jgi:hypothetical protein